MLQFDAAWRWNILKTNNRMIKIVLDEFDQFLTNGCTLKHYLMIQKISTTMTTLRAKKLNTPCPRKKTGKL